MQREIQANCRRCFSYDRFIFSKPDIFFTFLNLDLNQSNILSFIIIYAP